MYKKILQVNEDFTRKMLKFQQLNPERKYVGGIIDPIMGVAKPSHWHTPRVMASWVASIINPDSEYYHSQELVERLTTSSQFMLDQQHSDGTISLGATNYHSPPDTGFVVVGLSQLYIVVKNHKWDPLTPFMHQIELFLNRTIPALLTGGCHTPNHRWVISAALSFLYKIFKEEALVNRINEWLAEGLDYTEDGEWTERSNGIYNAVNNHMLYHLANNLDRPELFEPVRKNLDMMQFLVHPSGEVVTDYSGRQDFGAKSYLSPYYLIYRLMAARDQNHLFAFMADLAAEYIEEPESVDNNAMIGYLLFPSLKTDNLARRPIPNQYEKVINKDHPRSTYLAQFDSSGHTHKIVHSAPHTAFGSPVVRYRNDDTSATIMTNTPSFFSLRHGEVRLLGTKVTTSFSPGVVFFDEFGEVSGGYRLKKVMEKGYNGPIPKEQLATILKVEENKNPWYLLPHQHREITHLQKHEITVDVIPASDSWKIHIKSDQLEEVFTQITFILGSEGAISGEGLQEGKNGQYLLTEGKARYRVGTDIIEISPGAYEHWLDVLREDSHSPECKHVSINLMSPFNCTFEIKLLKDV